VLPVEGVAIMNTIGQTIAKNALHVEKNYQILIIGTVANACDVEKQEIKNTSGYVKTKKMIGVLYVEQHVIMSICGTNASARVEQQKIIIGTVVNACDVEILGKKITIGQRIVRNAPYAERLAIINTLGPLIARSQNAPHVERQEIKIIIGKGIVALNVAKSRMMICSRHLSVAFFLRYKELLLRERRV
jgi:hypothetical protein